jgi:hypothetical protein
MDMWTCGHVDALFLGILDFQGLGEVESWSLERNNGVAGDSIASIQVSALLAGMPITSPLNSRIPDLWDSSRHTRV